MYIKSLSIRNFRNFKAAKFFFVDNAVNTILGENASGKTNVFHAMRLVLDDSLPINARYLEAKDFCRDLGQVQGHWVVIQFSFGGLGASDEELVIANHSMEGQCDGTYTFIYRPKIHIRQKLFEISTSSSLPEVRRIAIDELLQSLVIGKEDYEVVAFTRTTVDFFDDGTYKQLAGDFDLGIYPDPETEDSALLGSSKPAYFSLIKEVTCTYVKALRNVVGDLKYGKSNPLYKLLSYKSAEIRGADHITENVKKLNEDISNLEQVKDLSQNIAKTLSSAVGQTYSPDISIASDLPEEITDLVQALSLIVEDSAGYQGTGNIEDLSLGGANLIYLALKLYEYEMQRDKDDKIAHFLLIEEPEAHIHNHIQKTLFSGFHSLNTQVIISTHSTQISSVSRISSINMIARCDGYSDVFWPSNKLSESEITGIERYLDAIRSTLLFAKSVILVEGDAEQVIIPQLVKAVFGVSLDEMGISLVNMDGTVFSHISNLFHQDRIRNFCSILTDRDASFLSSTTKYADEKYLKRLYDAAVIGEVRFNNLNAHCAGNAYVSAFFAKNTFETELILAKNKQLFIDTIPKIYQQQATIDKWTSFIEQGDKPSLCYAALHLANKVGKGWFAILLSESISSTMTIPGYILEAISHALKGHPIESTFQKAMDHRLRLHGRSLSGVMSDVNGVWSDCIDVFADVLPGDPLLTLMNK